MTRRSHVPLRISLRWALRCSGGATILLIAEAGAALLRQVPHQREFDASGVVGMGDIAERWLVLGDSSSTAPGVDRTDDIWIRQLARRRVSTGAIEITSLAVGGTTARHVRDDQIPLIDPETRFDVIFVSVGANDVLKGEPAKRYRKALDDITACLTTPRGRVVLSGVGDLSTIPRLLWPLDRLVGLRARRFDRIAGDIARAHGAIKVDHWRDTAPAFRNDPAIFSADLFHPGPRGHAVWAEAVDRLLNDRSP